jgi:hypothetical protein
MPCLPYLAVRADLNCNFGGCQKASRLWLNCHYLTRRMRVYSRGLEESNNTLCLRVPENL